MKCATHNQDAIAVCAYCGRAVCASCNPIPSSPRVACSDACAAALSKTDRAITQILAKNVQGARVAAWLCDISGIIFLAVAIYGYIIYPHMRITHPMTAALGIVLIVCGVSFHRIAKRG